MPHDSPPNPGDRAHSLRQLAGAAIAGDHPAFEQIHLRLARGVRRLLLDRVHGQADLADELCQQTWVGAWEALQAGRYDPARSEVSTFIYAIAYKTWLRHARNGPKAQALLSDEAASALAADDPDPLAFTQFCELLDAVRACMGGGPGDAPKGQSVRPELSDEDRLLLRGAAMGETDRDLAQRLGIAPSTVNVRKKAAFAKVRQYLNRLGLGLGPSPNGRAPRD